MIIGYIQLSIQGHLSTVTDNIISYDLFSFVLMIHWMKILQHQFFHHHSVSSYKPAQVITSSKQWNLSKTGLKTLAALMVFQLGHRRHNTDCQQMQLQGGCMTKQ